MRTTTITVVVCLAACGGGTTTTQQGHGGTGGDGAQNGGEHTPSWSDRAVQSYLEGSFDRAAAQADAALQLDHDDAHAMEVAARVALAHRDAAKAREVLANAHGPVLLRLRAKADVLAGDATAAVRDLEAVDGQEPADGWATAMLPILRAAGSDPLYATTGAPEATLDFVGGSADAAPLPIVRVTIEGRQVEALVSTAFGLTVVQQAAGSQERGRMLSSIQLGGLTLSHVPASVRDLADATQLTHRPIAAIIGAELLLRLHATLDGKHRRVVLRQAAPPRPATELPTVEYAAFDGALIAVRAGIENGPARYWEVDTSLEVPLVVGERAITEAHVAPARIQSPAGAPTGVRVVENLTLRLGDAQIAGVPGIVGPLPDELVQIAGTRIDGIIGAAVFSQLTVTIDTETRTLWLE